MLSYQHAYHAGNLADLHKHALLAVALNYLTRKDKPLSYLETHAGRGLYSLDGAEAAKTGEAQAGIRRAEAENWLPADHPLLNALAQVRRGYGASAYPGSPLIAAHFLRRGDSAHLAELHPAEYDALSTVAGFAYAKVFGGLEACGIDAIIPTKAEPIGSKVPLRRFKFDARHDLVKCPRGKILQPTKTRISHGGFFVTRVRDDAGCDLAALCLAPPRKTRAVVIVHDYPALLRARRRRDRWGEKENRLYRRHRARKVSTARQRHGTASPVQYVAGSRICAFKPSSPPQT